MSNFDPTLSTALDVAFGGLKPRRVSADQADFDRLTPELKRSNVARWIRSQDDAEAYVLDAMTDLCTTELLEHFESGDELAMGKMMTRILNRCYGARAFASLE